MLGLFKKKIEPEVEPKKIVEFDLDFLKEQNENHSGKIIYSEGKEYNKWEAESFNEDSWEGNFLQISKMGLATRYRDKNIYSIYKIDLFNFLMKNSDNFELMLLNIKDFIENTNPMKKWLINIDISKELSEVGFDFKDNVEKCILNLINFINDYEILNKENEKLLVQIHADFDDLKLLDNRFLFKVSEKYKYNIFVKDDDVFNFHQKFGSIFELIEKKYFLNVNLSIKRPKEKSNLKYDLLTIISSISRRYFKADLRSLYQWERYKKDFTGEYYFSNNFEPIRFQFEWWKKRKYIENKV